MRRRGVTVLLGAVVTALLSIGVLGAPIPYVVLGPGPTVDTLGSVEDKQVIQISGVETSDSAGQLRLTTVGVQPDVSLLSAIAGWISDDEAVVPRETVYPPGRTDRGDRGAEQAGLRPLADQRGDRRAAASSATRCGWSSTR